MPEKPLKSLPFQDAGTPTVTSIDEQRVIKAKIHDNLIDYGARGKKADFMAKVASICINDVSVTGLSNTPIHLSRNVSKSRDLIIPLSSTLAIQTAKAKVKIETERECYLEGYGEQSFGSSFGAYIRIKCDLNSVFADPVFLQSGKTSTPSRAFTQAQDYVGQALMLDKIPAIEVKYMLSLLNLHHATPKFLSKLCIDHLIFNLLKRLLSLDSFAEEKNF